MEQAIPSAHCNDLIARFSTGKRVVEFAANLWSLRHVPCGSATQSLRIMTDSIP
jgi:hypothetical protein